MWRKVSKVRFKGTNLCMQEYALQMVYNNSIIIHSFFKFNGLAFARGSNSFGRLGTTSYDTTSEFYKALQTSSKCNFWFNWFVSGSLILSPGCLWTTKQTKTLDIIILNYTVVFIFSSSSFSFFTYISKKKKNEINRLASATYVLKMVLRLNRKF